MSFLPSDSASMTVYSRLFSRYLTRFLLWYAFMALSGSLSFSSLLIVAFYPRAAFSSYRFPNCLCDVGCELYPIPRRVLSSPCAFEPSLVWLLGV